MVYFGKFCTCAWLEHWMREAASWAHVFERAPKCGAPCIGAVVLEAETDRDRWFGLCPVSRVCAV